MYVWFFSNLSLFNIILSICKPQKMIVTLTFTCSFVYIVYFISIITDNETLSEKINYCKNIILLKSYNFIFAVVLYCFKTEIRTKKNKSRENSYRVSCYWKVSSPEMISLINERISRSGALGFPFPASLAFSLALALRLRPYMKR